MHIFFFFFLAEAGFQKKKEKCVAVTGPHKKYNPNCSAACWCFHLELETTRTVGAGSSDRSLEGTWLQPTSAVVPELFGLQRSLKVWRLVLVCCWSAGCFAFPCLDWCCSGAKFFFFFFEIVAPNSWRTGWWTFCPGDNSFESWQTSHFEESQWYGPHLWALHKK